MRVKFTGNAVANFGNGKEVVFPEGATEDLSDDSARRWIRRGVAVEVTEKPAAKKKAKKKAAK